MLKLKNKHNNINM